MRVIRGASRCQGERRRSSITCTSSLSPAANDFNDRPQIIRLRSCPRFMARITQISHIHKIPVVPRHPRTNKRFFELELTSLLSALYAPISKHFIQTDRPILRRDSGQTRLWICTLRRGWGGLSGIEWVSPISVHGAPGLTFLRGHFTVFRV